MMFPVGWNMSGEDQMKILVVCQYYKPEPFRISDICEALAEAGHKVTVVTGIPNYPEGEIYTGYEKTAGQDVLDNGVHIHRCYTIPRKTGALYRMLNYFSFAWSSARYLSRTTKEYDVVFVNQLSPVMMAWGAIRYARKWNKKVVLYCLDLWPESLQAGGIRKGSLIYNIFLAISKKVYCAVDRVLITSKGFANYLNEYIGVKGECGYLPQYAEATFDDVPDYVPHDAPYHFMFAGNIGEMQSVDTIIEAARALEHDSRVVFDIVGDGSALQHCKKLAEGLENVIFCGRKGVEEMPFYYAKADAMLVTMKDNPEIALTLPGKVQSYMAAGRTLIGSIGGETAQVICDAGCGICVAPEDGKALAAAIKELLDNPENLVKYADNSRAYYRTHFRKESFVNKLINELAEYSK